MQFVGCRYSFKYNGRRVLEYKGGCRKLFDRYYTKLRDTSNSTLHFEDRGDAFTTGLEGGPSNLWAQNLTSQNGYGWSSYYSVIQHCNMLLKYTPGISFGSGI